MIFDDKARIGIDPAMQSESFYSYLDRSARSEADQIRNIIEEWAALYPATEHPNFIKKLRSADDKVFLPAFFELYLYVLMKKLNVESIDIEPPVKGITTRPDFHAHFPADEDIYVEARCLSEDEDYISQDDVITGIAERIDKKLKWNNIGLGLHWDGNPSGSDFSTKMLKELIGWYKNLTQNDVTRRTEKLFEFDDWFIKFTVEGQINGSNRVVHAVMPQTARIVTVDERLRSALRKKGKRYGKLPNTFIIAVNITDGTYEHQIHNAIFGNEADEFNTQTRQHQNIRMGNGFWRGETKWHYTRVGAIIITNKLNPWTIFSPDEKQVQIYHHPGLPAQITPFDRLPTFKKNGDDIYGFHDGESARSILNLPVWE
jgi:hypothetical protein